MLAVTELQCRIRKFEILTFHKHYGLIWMQFIPFRPEIAENTRTPKNYNIFWRCSDRIMCYIESFKFRHQAWNENSPKLYLNKEKN